MAKAKTATSGSTPGSPAGAPIPVNVKFASIYPGPPPRPALIAKHRVPNDLVQAVSKIEGELGMPVWLLVQDGEDENTLEGDSFNIIGELVASAFFTARHGSLAKGQRVALLIDSPGGMARQTYEVAMLLRRHC